MIARSDGGGVKIDIAPTRTAPTVPSPMAIALLAALVLAGACSPASNADGSVDATPVTPIDVEAADAEHRETITAPDPAGAEDAPVELAATADSFGDSFLDAVFAADVFTAGHDDLLAATREPDPAEPGGWRGIFRINCDLSHASYNDPIVVPGEEGGAHLHRFYGNTAIDHTTTIESLHLEGDTTCQGGELNRSGYWIPSLLAPSSEADGWQPVPAVVGGDDEAHEVFYYSAAVDDLESVQPLPEGLRMVAGDPTATPEDPQDTSIVRWHCQSWASDDATNPVFTTTIPACEAPDRVRMDIFFPSCWNGVDLDSDDHRSHMAYPVRVAGETVCPETHPVPVVRVSYHYAFGVKPDVYDPETRTSTGWRLSSDGYTVDGGSGGASLHADWINGWHPEVMAAIVEGCIRSGLDCHDGNLANGFRLSGVDDQLVASVHGDGAGLDPEVVLGGLGAHAGHS